MRIATFNANSIRSRQDVILAWLAKHSPDVLCIQETKVEDKDFPVQAFEGSGYNVIFRGQKSYNGVAMFSRLKASDVRFGLDDGKQPDEPRLLCAKVGPVYVVNTYVPQGRSLDNEMYAYKLEWFARLKAFFDRHFTPGSKLVWLGDLNIAPEPMDVHNPEEQEDHVCFHVEARRAFKDVVSWGFVDVFRKYHPEPGKFTFFDYRMPGSVDRGLGWRVDHILATKALAAKSMDSWIDIDPRHGPRPSDHTFLAADFDVS